MFHRVNIVGRYAPSPTGEQHFGNLRTALLAWLQARLQGGQFLLRMEDLDTPRVVMGSADQILFDLEWLGLDWDGAVLLQSQRTEAYSQALQQLQDDGLVYPCFCSRKDIQQAASAPHDQHGFYPGTCAHLSEQTIKTRQAQKTPAIRLKVGPQEIEFNDGCLGVQRDRLDTNCGDFVVRRADGLFAYQLAVIVDDLQQGVTDVVRGADLLSSTARQLYIARLLGFGDKAPNYFHVPLMLNDSGDRMAKRGRGSMSINAWQATGGTASGLIGKLAHSCGLLDSAAKISAEDLLSNLCYADWRAALCQF